MIRTSDPLLPKQMRYQAALRPEPVVYRKVCMRKECFYQNDQYVILSKLVNWVDEEFFGFSNFNQFTQMKICCPIGYPGSLLHRVGNITIVYSDLNRDKLLNFRRSDWVESRTRLIHKNYLRIDCDCSCNTKTLLLTTR